MVLPQETKWTHAPFSGHESRCCSFCNKRAKMLRMRVRNGAECSRLPLVRPSWPLLRAPPGTRPRRTARGRVSRPGRTGRTLCRAVAVRCIRHRLRRHAATTGAVAAALVSDTATATGTTPTITGVAPPTGPTSRRCVSHCLLVVLQHLGHGCLHGPAGLLALLAQLAAQGQGGRPR